MGQLISVRYARALFELAIEKNEVDTYYEQVVSLTEILNENKDFYEVLSNPSILNSDKMKIIENTLRGKAADDIIGFLSIILQKGRISELMNIFEAFVGLVHEHKNQVIAYVTTAIEMTDRQLSDIKAVLTQKLNKQVEIEAKVDEGLIAGIRIIAGGKVIDASVKNQLEKMKRELLDIQLV